MWNRLFVILSLALAGCSAQKATLSADVRTAESETQHREALQALETRRFIIKTEEFYLPGKDPITSRDSYISMQGNRGVIRYSPELFPDTDYNCLNIEDERAELTKLKARKNGDTEFRLKIEDEPKYWLNGDMTLILYKNSNKCMVRVDLGTRIIRFTGYIYPYEEELHK